MGGRRYRVASQSLWDSARQRPFARQAILGPADPPPVADLASTRTVGTRRVGDIGALVWVAEQLDLVKLIDQACGLAGPADGPTVGEMVLAVAVQRACAPAAKCHLAAFLESCLPRVSCLPAAAFTGQTFHRLAARVSQEQLEQAQIEIARAAARRFELSTDVLAFDTTNFDTHIATTTGGELARRGKAKSKRSDLRVVGLAALVSETGHVPLLHRTYPGNGSDQTVLSECLDALGKLHDALDDAEQRIRPACRTLVRDGGSWSEQLELDLDVEGYYTLISLPLSHSASQLALEQAARRGAMKPLGGKLEEVRAARLRTRVGELDRTLVVVESQELLRGQKRGIAVALRKAKKELRQLERRAARGRIPARGTGGSGWQGVATRAPVGIRDRHGARGAWAGIAPLARRCGSAPPIGAHAPGTARVVYGSPYLELWPDRTRFPRSVECGGTVPQGQERRGGILGTFPSMGRQLVAVAHLCHGNRLDAGQPGSPDTRYPEVRRQHDAGTLGDESDSGARAHEGTWPPRDGNACARPNGGTTQGGQELRSRPLDADTSFI